MSEYLTFTLPYPPSVNALYRNVPKVGRVKTKATEAFNFQAALALAGQRANGIKGTVNVTYEVGRFPDKRRRDVGNYEKALSDALVANGIIEDDSLIEWISIGWVDGVEGVRVTVEAA